MTSSSCPGQSTRPAWPSAGLVLVAPGGVSAAEGLRLADLLGLRLLACSAELQSDPNAALAGLAQEPSGWLLPLAVDPAAALEQPGSWSEALGAWRQPVVVQLPALMAAAGPARAYAALLTADAVPLVGLLQLGEPWQPEQRRMDALPWLGCLPEEEAFASADPAQEREALRLNLMARWQLSSARAAAPDHPVA
jgi:hypothetical protein